MELKIWQSYAIWIPFALFFEVLAVAFSARPPLDGFALFSAYFEFFWIVLAGPFFLLQFMDLGGMPIFLLGLCFGAGAIAILAGNRNRKPGLNVLAGLLWCFSGAITLWVGITTTI